ncbi:MAG: hypothetical protein K8R21_01830 [Leptospira sp.]|nr:hypothetical protein [Leptospira sp.]
MIQNANKPVSQKELSQLVVDIFFAPHEAFEEYLSTETVGRRELLTLHFLLWMIAPLFKIVSNLIILLFNTFVQDPNYQGKIFSGVLSSFLIYPAVIFIVSILDILRVYYRKINRVENETLPAHGILLIAFLPFSASSIFWIFPPPVNFIFILISLIYSLQLSHFALENISGYDKKQFMFFGLISLIFLLSGAVFISAGLNILRMILN